MDSRFNSQFAIEEEETRFELHQARYNHLCKWWLNNKDWDRSPLVYRWIMRQMRDYKFEIGYAAYAAKQARAVAEFNARIKAARP